MASKTFDSVQRHIAPAGSVCFFFYSPFTIPITFVFDNHDDDDTDDGSEDNNDEEKKEEEKEEEG